MQQKRNRYLLWGTSDQQIFQKSNIPEIVVIADCCHAECNACELEREYANSPAVEKEFLLCGN